MCVLYLCRGIMPGDRFTLLLFLNFLFLLMFPHLCYGLGVRMLDGFLPNLRMYVLSFSLCCTRLLSPGLW